MIELFELERKMIYVKADKHWFKYWKLKRKYNKLKKKLNQTIFYKK